MAHEPTISLCPAGLRTLSLARILGFCSPRGLFAYARISLFFKVVADEIRTAVPLIMLEPLPTAQRSPFSVRVSLSGPLNVVGALSHACQTEWLREGDITRYSEKDA